MEKIENLLNKYWFVVLVLLTIPAIWSLTVPGFYGASDDMHPAWIQQMDRSIRFGNFPPRFAPDLSFGFGYPLWNFISPLPFYIGTLIHNIGFNFVDSTKLVFGLSVIISSFGMYWLVRSLSTPIIGLSAAVLYTYTPYRAVDLYVRGAIGELWAFVFFPLVILAIIQRHRVLGALAVAGLILSHNIGTYMFLPFAVILGIGLAFNERSRLKDLLFIFGFGALVSIYFWLPALLDSKLMRYDTLFSFADHFPVLKQLVTPYWGYGGSHSGPDDGMSYFLGITSILSLIMGIGLLGFFWKRLSGLHRIVAVWSLFVFITSVFMMNYRSTLFWITLPMLDYFQFPWRFLMMTTLVIPLLLVALNNFKYGRWIALLVIFLSISTAASYFRPEHFLGRTDEYFFKRYIPVPVAQTEYLEIQEEYLRLPKATQTRPDRNYPRIELSEGAVAKVSGEDSLKTQVEVTSDKDTTLNFNRYSFPGWYVTVNGQQAYHKVGEPFGQINLDLPAGTHLLAFEFKEPPLKLLLDIISVLTIIFLVVISVRGRKK